MCSIETKINEKVARLLSERRKIRAEFEKNGRRDREIDYELAQVAAAARALDVDLSQ